MDKEIKKQLIKTIKNDLSDRFRVIDNTANNKQLIVGTFPDIILMRQIPPDNEDILFVMRIEDKDTELFDSISTWRDLERSGISFYLIVPENKLDEARRLAEAIEVSAKFASYTIKPQNKIEVSYE